MNEDPGATLAALQQLDDLSLYVPGTRLVVDLAEVTAFDAPALLYFCSRLRALSTVPHLEVRGTYPMHPKAVAALRDASFEAFLGRRDGASDLPASVSLCEGTTKRHQQVKPSIAIQIKRFLNRKNPELTLPELDMLFHTLGESMENVQAHAYQQAERNRGWYAVGLYDDDTRTSSVAILDMGVGIRRTVERQLELTAIVGWKSNADFLEEASSGLRNAARSRKHGKGLNTLRKFATAAPGRKFHILSSGARIVWSADPAGPIKQSVLDFLGTIVCLEVCDAEHGSS